jgi:hypothetical protein
MQRYEFTVIPAPRKGEKARGVKTTEDRFALALTTLMNRMGAEGWDYVRADVLPCDERVGLTGSKTTYQNMLVFRRPIEAPVLAAAAPLVPAPTAHSDPALVLRAPVSASPEEVTPARLGATLSPPPGLAPPVGAATAPKTGPYSAPPVGAPRTGASVD